MKRPFWLFSHIFAASVIALFIFLGFWQLDRLGLRKAQNETIIDRTDEPPAMLQELLEEPIDELEFRRIADTGRFIDGDVVRIGSQSKDGSAGDHVVGLVELSDGTRLLVNRGFVPLAAVDQLKPPPEEEITVAGWIRLSQTKEGVFGAADGQLTAERLPRFNVATIEDRVDGDVAAVYVQLNADALDPESELESDVSSFPTPLALPPLSEGSHLSYAVQWFIFAVLGAAFYVALVRRIARTSAQKANTDPE